MQNHIAPQQAPATAHQPQTQPPNQANPTSNGISTSVPTPLPPPLPQLHQNALLQPLQPHIANQGPMSLLAHVTSQLAPVPSTQPLPANLHVAAPLALPRIPPPIQAATVAVPISAPAPPIAHVPPRNAVAAPTVPSAVIPPSAQPWQQITQPLMPKTVPVMSTLNPGQPNGHTPSPASIPVIALKRPAPAPSALYATPTAQTLPVKTTPLRPIPPVPTASARTLPPGQARVTNTLSPIQLGILKLISDYLGPAELEGNLVGATLPALRDAIEKGRAKAGVGNSDLQGEKLSWQVREAIRTELFKIQYPQPPSVALLNLVTKSEIVMNGDQAILQRPFYYPGARVLVPVENGLKRVGTTLQLRKKELNGVSVTQALLHVDAPKGGSFQWVETGMVAPVPGSHVVSNPAPQKRNAGRGRGRRGRGSRGAGSRGSRGGRRGPRGRGAASAAAHGVPFGAMATNVVAGVPANVYGLHVVGGISRGAGGPGRVSGASGKGSGGAKANSAAARAAAAGARSSHADQSAVSVPPSLVCPSPPPRTRILDAGRHVSFASGSLRRALDMPNDGMQSAGKLRAVLGVQRLTARRNVASIGVQYFVKWSGRPMREGSWELRKSLSKDVPGLVREFDVRHPQESVVIHLEKGVEGEGERKSFISDLNLAKKALAEKEKKINGKCSDNDGDTAAAEKEVPDCLDVSEVATKKEKVKETVHFKDDISGVEIPSYVDTPIAELTFGGMVLQIRRPNEYSLHNDSDAAARDGKRRLTEFKKKNIESAAQVYKLSRVEARHAIENGLRKHRDLEQRAIPFPRGIGQVSAGDHGIPFSKRDSSLAPANWDGYFAHLGMRCTDFTRDMPPYMPTLDDSGFAKVVRAKDEAVVAMGVEHRERARTIARNAFRHDGSGIVPAGLFRNGVRNPPGTGLAPLKRARLSAAGSNNGVVGDGGFSRSSLLRAREDMFDDAIKNASGKRERDGRSEGMWFDSVWSCWRKTPPTS